jgi:hypothetical protein
LQLRPPEASGVAEIGGRRRELGRAADPRRPLAETSEAEKAFTRREEASGRRAEEARAGIDLKKLYLKVINCSMQYLFCA